MRGTELLNRRSLLKIGALGAVAGGIGLSSGAFSTGPTETLCVQQPGRITSVEPLSGSRVVGAYYDYSGSAPNTGNERPHESTIAFYDGPGGRSLVITHGQADHPNQKQGGVSLSFDGLPVEHGAWAQRDDADDWDRTEPEDRSTAPELAPGSPPERVQWRWERGQGDGAIFSGDFRSLTPLTVTPNFAWGIADWTFLSGDPEDPDRIPLDPTRPLRIHRVRGRPGAVRGTYDSDAETVSLRMTPEDGVDPSAIQVDRVEFGAAPGGEGRPGVSGTTIETTDQSAEVSIASTAEDGDLVVDVPVSPRPNSASTATTVDGLPETVVGTPVTLTATDEDGVSILAGGRIQQYRHKRLGLFFQQGNHRERLAVQSIDEPVRAFYDYRDYRPNTGVESSRSSVIYPVDGPRGTSLVFLHGKAEDGSPGSIQMRFSGLRSGTSWVLKDDVSDWRREGSSPPSRIHWKWDKFDSRFLDAEPTSGDQADGGILRGRLDSPFQIRVDPTVEYGIDDLLVPIATGEMARFDPTRPFRIRRWFW